MDRESEAEGYCRLRNRPTSISVSNDPSGTMASPKYALRVTLALPHIKSGFPGKSQKSRMARSQGSYGQRYFTPALKRKLKRVDRNTDQNPIFLRFDDIPIRTTSPARKYTYYAPTTASRFPVTTSHTILRRVEVYYSTRRRRGGGGGGGEGGRRRGLAQLVKRHVTTIAPVQGARPATYINESEDTLLLPSESKALMVRRPEGVSGSVAMAMGWDGYGVQPGISTLLPLFLM
ncbi:hypothetical protein V1478_011423 [Vespula squamosa]|uniref:Uncharacterized protein n=1 Tax=Vespula squamosa TaxID=30214 RepID=A0ABD2AEF8_VESSQ